MEEYLYCTKGYVFGSKMAGGYWALHSYLGRSLDPHPLSILPLLSDTRVSWARLWNAKVPPKVKIYVWRLANELVPTWANLVVRHITTDLECVLCGAYGESTIYPSDEGMTLRKTCVDGLTGGSTSEEQSPSIL